METAGAAHARLRTAFVRSQPPPQGATPPGRGTGTRLCSQQRGQGSAALGNTERKHGREAGMKQ